MPFHQPLSCVYVYAHLENDMFLAARNMEYSMEFHTFLWVAKLRLTQMVWQWNGISHSAFCTRKLKFVTAFHGFNCTHYSIEMELDVMSCAFKISNSYNCGYFCNSKIIYGENFVPHSYNISNT